MIAAAFFLLGVVVGMAFLGICLAWDRQPKPRPKPRRESLSERHDRLDAEARIAANEPAFERLGRSANR